MKIEHVRANHNNGGRISTTTVVTSGEKGVHAYGTTSDIPEYRVFNIETQIEDQKLDLVDHRFIVRLTLEECAQIAHKMLAYAQTKGIP